MIPIDRCIAIGDPTVAALRTEPGHCCVACVGGVQQSGQKGG
jgi:hypothetical protein